MPKKKTKLENEKMKATVTERKDGSVTVKMKAKGNTDLRDVMKDMGFDSPKK